MGADGAFGVGFGAPMIPVPVDRPGEDGSGAGDERDVPLSGAREGPVPVLDEPSLSSDDDPLVDLDGAPTTPLLVDRRGVDEDDVSSSDEYSLGGALDGPSYTGPVAAPPSPEPA